MDSRSAGRATGYFPIEPTELAFVNGRLQTVRDSQQRARTALLIVAFAVAIVLITLWNAYLGWNLGLARSDLIALCNSPDQSKPGIDGRNESRHALIRNWVDSQFISIPLLGIKVSSDDAAVIGGIILLVLNYYYCLCVRRENQDLAAFLKESRTLLPVLRKHIYWSVNAGNVFNIDLDDRPMYSDGPRRPERNSVWPPSMRVILWTFVYAPFVAVLLIVCFDLYCVVGHYDSPFRAKGKGLWSSLEDSERLQLLSTDIFAIMIAVVMLTVCAKVRAYHKATRELIENFNPESRESQA